VLRHAVVREPLSVDRLTAAIERDAQATAGGCGALCSFVGVVRGVHQGRRVRFLEYEAFEPLAVKVFAQIGDEAEAQWPGTRAGIHHRVGRLEVGDASVVIVAASAHRAEAFRACRYAIERVKQVAPVWKHEFFEGGDAWLEGALADPADEAARQAALALACA